MKNFYKVLLTTVITILALNIYAQNVTVLFTARNTMFNTNVQMDSVVITNISRGWTESIIYPDTVLILTCETTFAKPQNNNLDNSSVKPNPFAGTTQFSLNVEKACNVDVQISDINGRLVLANSEFLKAGNYVYQLSLKEAGAYILSVNSADGIFSSKLINTENAGENKLMLTGDNAQINAKSTSENCLFEVGDIMNYVGYKTINGQLNESTAITQVQTGSEIITLNFNMCESYEYEFWDIALVDYTWNDSTYTESGDYDQIFQDANGCDSLVTLHLTISDMGHEWVDLGLPSGTKWATMNIGADTIIDAGDYFAWGEIAPKETYSEFNYLHTDEDLGDISGNSLYDAARANWGGTWRMPTEAELRELMQYCTISFYYSTNPQTQTVYWYNDMVKFVGPNGNYIEIPLGGSIVDETHSSGAIYSGETRNSAIGRIWCSNFSIADTNNALNAYFYLMGGSNTTNFSSYKGVGTNLKHTGLPIRPVSD